MHQHLLVNVNRFLWRTFKNLLTLIKQYGTVAVFCDTAQIVADKQNRLALFFEILKLALTFRLKKDIADRQCLIDDQDLRINVDGNRKCQAHKHTA